jgi:hypothetical protein
VRHYPDFVDLCTISVHQRTYFWYHITPLPITPSLRPMHACSTARDNGPVRPTLHDDVARPQSESRRLPTLHAHYLSSLGHGAQQQMHTHVRYHMLAFRREPSRPASNRTKPARRELTLLHRSLIPNGAARLGDAMLQQGCGFKSHVRVSRVQGAYLAYPISADGALSRGA